MNSDNKKVGNRIERTAPVPPAIDPDAKQAEWSKAIAAAGVETEAQMRERKAAWPHTEGELLAEIRRLVDRPHDYGTCVYAMSLAAVAAFNYVCDVLGTTGFQASCADMDILRRTRSLKGPYMLMDGYNLLYPQCDLREKLEKFIDDARPWLRDEAKRLLADTQHAHPDVIARWQTLAADDADDGARQP